MFGHQVLVITERFALDDRPRWKFPGGLVQAGESLADAVAREVVIMLWDSARVRMIILGSHHRVPYRRPTR